jgi:hypothetical protein
MPLGCCMPIPMLGCCIIPGCCIPIPIPPTCCWGIPPIPPIPPPWGVLNKFMMSSFET